MSRTIGVCGLGKLGSPIAAVFAEAGVNVVGYDTNDKKVRTLAAHMPPVDEPDLGTVIRNAGDRLRAVHHLTEMVEATEGCIFVTPTPSEPNGGFDHGYLRAALIRVSSKAASMGKTKYAFIVASTVMPGFMATDARPLLAGTLGEDNFLLAYKPEFIALGTVIHDLHSPDVALFGADSEEAREYAVKLYSHILSGFFPVYHCMSLVEAELAKISLNCAVTMKISFANQVAMVAEELGADARRVLEAVGADHRVGSAALRPGLPFGGPCFPRDNRMFRRVASQVGRFSPLATATDAVNELALAAIMRRVPERGTIGILGLAYKPGTPITEEAPGTQLKTLLEERGRAVKAHDMRAPHKDSLADVMECDTVLVMCDWPEYRGLEFPSSTLVIDPYGVTVVSNPQLRVAGHAAEKVA